MEVVLSAHALALKALINTPLLITSFVPGTVDGIVLNLIRR